MAYPSLLYSGNPPEATITDEVFEDVKLNLLLDAEVTDIMRRPCGCDDITARQNIFRSLATDEAAYSLRDTFNKLYPVSQKLTELYGDYSSAVCPEERDILCVSLVRELICFSCLAAGMKSDLPICRRFSNYFKLQTEKEIYKSAEKACSTLCELEKALGSFVCRVSGTVHTLSSVTPGCDGDKSASGGGESYLTRLLRCSDKFGFSDVRPEPTAPIRSTKGIISAAARLYPNVFAELRSFFLTYSKLIDSDILRFRTELKFYLSVARLSERLSSSGIPVCYPEIAQKSEITLRDAYDITLLEKGEEEIIPNSATFTPGEPLFFLTGANGGGKTTFLRTVGVSVLLFLCGAPVPCEWAKIFPLRAVYTHFPHDERFGLTGRFLDEQSRVREILEGAGEGTLVLLNETYSTTNEKKAIAFTASLARELYEKGAFGIYVTHHSMDGIAEAVGDDIRIPVLHVMLARDGIERTYKVERREYSGGSHASDILERYHLDRKSLEERFGNLL